MKTPAPHRFKFEPQFVPLVAAEEKRCTIRQERKRKAAVGEACILEFWTGGAYRSKVARIGTSRFTKVLPVTIDVDDGRIFGIRITLDGVELLDSEANCLAQDDGFSDADAMAYFFKSRCPFVGHFYQWEALE